jgi:signal transduction histidine kinase
VPKTYCSLVVLNSNKDLIIQTALKDVQGIKSQSKALIDILKLMPETKESSFYIKAELEHILFNTVQNKHKQRVKTIISSLRAFNGDVLYTIEIKDKIQGFFIISPRTDGRPHYETDLELIDEVITAFSISVSKALLSEAVIEFNKTLQKKVSEQTLQLQDKVKLLEEARRKENDLMDIMGHELRTPATIAKINAEMLKKYSLELATASQEDYERILKRISDSIDTEIRLINTLLLSAKLEGDKLELRKEEVDVINAIEMSIHGNEAKAAQKDLAINFTAPDKFPKAIADKGRFQEITDNLIGNAIKYTEKGSVTINVSHTEDFIKVDVQDTGRGIPENLVHKLGKKFYRVEQYIKDTTPTARDIVRPGGTGLGLFVVFGLVKAHGGEIIVKSELDKGSTFSFTIPIFKESDKKNLDQDTEKDLFSKFGLKH